MESEYRIDKAEMMNEMRRRAEANCEPQPADVNQCNTLKGGEAGSLMNASIYNLLMQEADHKMSESYSLHDQGTTMKQMADGLKSLAGCLPHDIPEPAYRVLKLMLRTFRF